MSEELSFAPVTELVRLIRNRDLSPVELSELFLNRIQELDGEIGAFCTVDVEQVRQAAREAERAQMRGEMGPLHGIPVGVKDLIFTRGLRTTGGSSIYAELVPDEDDVVVERLRQSGAVILGKTNTAEFGFSANQTSNVLFGPTRNPWDRERSPGGSSGGSAAAVAAGLAPVALASDGGGSIRIPSSFCGLYGIKPTFGLVPLYPGCRDARFPGLSGWESLEHIGPITRTVADTALLLDLLTGPDSRDRHSLPQERPGSFSRALEDASTDLTGLRIAWSADWGGEESVDEEVRASLERSMETLRALGAEVVPDQPARPASRDAFGALIAMDADPHALRLLIDDHESTVSPRLKSMMRREWTYEELTAAFRLRKQMYGSVDEFFRRYDVFVTPTVPFTALPLGAEGPETIGGVVPADQARAVIGYCYPFNITGHPAASIPCGLDSAGLPIGMQIVAGRLRDDLVLRLSKAYEQASSWQGRRPHPSRRADAVA